MAARFAGGKMAVELIRLVWTRVRRAEGEIQRLLALFQAGRLQVRTGVICGRTGGRTGGGRAGASSGMPRGVAWLLPMVPSEAACYAGQMSCLLAEPEMVALLVASPQARRVLAPLCRMLGIEAALLTPPGAVRAPGPSAEPGDVEGDTGGGSGGKPVAPVPPVRSEGRRAPPDPPPPDRPPRRV